MNRFLLSASLLMVLGSFATSAHSAESKDRPPKDDKERIRASYAYKGRVIYFYDVVNGNGSLVSSLHTPERLVGTERIPAELTVRQIAARLMREVGNLAVPEKPPERKGGMSEEEATLTIEFSSKQATVQVNLSMDPDALVDLIHHSVELKAFLSDLVERQAKAYRFGIVFSGPGRAVARPGDGKPE